MRGERVGQKCRQDSKREEEKKVRRGQSELRSKEVRGEKAVTILVVNSSLYYKCLMGQTFVRS